MEQLDKDERDSLPSLKERVTMNAKLNGFSNCKVRSFFC